MSGEKLIKSRQMLGKNVISTRVFWDRMLDRAIDKYEYGGGYDTFVVEMQRLGFTTEQVEELTSYDDD